jgi:hypothetical protein
MEPINLTTRDFYIYALLINVGLGFLFGLIPLVFGIMKGQRKYGFLGLILSVVGGGLLGLLLAIPVAAIFTWLIFSRSGKAQTSSSDDAAAS